MYINKPSVTKIAAADTRACFMYFDCTLLLTSVDLNSQRHALCISTVLCCLQVLI